MIDGVVVYCKEIFAYLISRSATLAWRSESLGRNPRVSDASSTLASDQCREREEGGGFWQDSLPEVGREVLLPFDRMWLLLYLPLVAESSRIYDAASVTFGRRTRAFRYDHLRTFGDTRSMGTGCRYCQLNNCRLDRADCFFHQDQ